ncbi:MAG TPA: hypothetical protein VJS11_00075, partial [Acidobacteriaceae bacterium]|nr:hypothetical protein [Acidobacteriaceae bacterium]
ILAAYLADTVKARMLRPDGSYIRVRELGRESKISAFSAQDFFIAVAEGRADAGDIPRVHVPAEPKRRVQHRAKRRAHATAAD